VITSCMTRSNKPKCQPTHANVKQECPYKGACSFISHWMHQVLLRATKWGWSLNVVLLFCCGMLGWHALLFHTACIMYHHGQQNKDGPWVWFSFSIVECQVGTSDSFLGTSLGLTINTFLWGEWIKDSSLCELSMCWTLQNT